MSDTAEFDPAKRREAAAAVRQAYNVAIAAVRVVGKTIRGSACDGYGWSSDHKTAMSGLGRMLGAMRTNVPRYDGTDP